MSQQSWEVYTGGTAPGSPTVPNIKDALKACQSMHCGDAEPAYKMLGMKWYDTLNNQIKFYDGTSWIVEALVDESGHLITLYSAGAALVGDSEIALAVNDTTPSVAGGKNFRTANTSITTILPDGASTGDRISIRIDDTNTIFNGAMTKTGRTIPSTPGDTWEGVWGGSNWKQTGGSVGMGGFVSLTSPTSITTWIGINQITFYDVNVSTFARKGANAVLIKAHIRHNSGSVGLYLRRKGSAHDSSDLYLSSSATWNQIGGQLTVGVNDDCIFQARHSQAIDQSYAHLVGYYI